MADPLRSATRQRSFRMPVATLRELELRAREVGETANSLARRLIQEGLQTERHPLVYFRAGAGGRRPAILGTRLDVWHLVEYLDANDDNAREVGQLLDVPEHWVQAAADYYAEYPDDIDAWAAEQSEFSRRAEDAIRQRATPV